MKRLTPSAPATVSTPCRTEKAKNSSIVTVNPDGSDRQRIFDTDTSGLDATMVQRGMAGASEELKAEMLELNLAYQERFGHVFLICATGATGEQMRDAVQARIGNPPEREREIVRTELGKINRIRLTRLVQDS